MVGICGSDVHFFAGELRPASQGSLYPRVQGHELCGVVEELGAFVEPVAVAAHGVARAGVAAGEAAGEAVVVLGAGPIGQTVALCAAARGARTMVVDPLTNRRELALELGAESACDLGEGDLAGRARTWAAQGARPWSSTRPGRRVPSRRRLTWSPPPAGSW